MLIGHLWTEAKTGLAIVENVLWSSVPAFLRKLNDVVLTECGESLPLDMAPIKIASWMGGDRDGTFSFIFNISIPSIRKNVL